ncbi:MAG: adenylyl-sulfate kinase [Candidatus Schekmanbacteria bacterium]|nr:adenylyl-sulfate kinase [Candidatus Schekmanbacteria bacterium]
MSKGNTKGFTIWFTGLSGAGKTTLAHKVHEFLVARGIMNLEILDGDVVRTHLSKGLGFSKEDRDTNIRRIGWVCQLLTKHGVPNIAAAISPYKEIRNEVRQMVGNFVEVYVKCPLDTLVQRDVKGLYKKALAGEVKNFTGVSDPYEEPDNPELVIESNRETVEESAQRIIAKLEEMGFIAPKEHKYSKEEEEEIAKRLESLGYL